MKELDEIADAVEDEQSFIAFLGALGDDFALERRIESSHPSRPYASGALGWEHSTVDDVFEAAAAWGESSSPRWKASGDQNPWRRCAQILLGGKYYE